MMPFDPCDMGYLSIGTKLELIFGQEELTLSSPHHTRSGRVYIGAYSVFHRSFNSILLLGRGKQLKKETRQAKVCEGG